MRYLEVFGFNMTYTFDLQEGVGKHKTRDILGYDPHEAHMFHPNQKWYLELKILIQYDE
jgi:hypothetical protein